MSISFLDPRHASRAVERIVEKSERVPRAVGAREHSVKLADCDNSSLQALLPMSNETTGNKLAELERRMEAVENKTLEPRESRIRN